MARYKIAFFLEDSAQEALIPNLVRRLIGEEGKNPADYDPQVWSSRGGGSIRAYRNFIKSVKNVRRLSQMF